MPRDFFPRRDEDVLIWSRAFLRGIQSHESHFGLSEADVELFAQLQQNFALMYRQSIEPGTRTTPVTSGKNQARRELEIVARRFSRIVKSFDGLTGEDRALLGIASNNPHRRRMRPGPVSAPILKLLSIKGHTVTLRLFDANSATSRARPKDTLGATLFSFVGENPPPVLTYWQRAHGTSKTVTSFDLDPSLLPSTQIWLTAFWFGTRSQPSPLADPISFEIPRAIGRGNFSISHAGRRSSAQGASAMHTLKAMND